MSQNQDTSNASPSHPTAAKPFGQITSPWIAAGFAVAPARGPADKRPGVKWGPLRHGMPPDFWAEDAADWYDLRVAGLLLLDSGPEDFRLIIVDVDDRAQEAWARRVYGETRVSAPSPRGVHLYYRAPADHGIRTAHGIVGPPEAIKANGNTSIDIKARGAYVVLRTLHLDGRPTDPEGGEELLSILRHAVPFDLEVHGREHAAGMAQRQQTNRTDVTDDRESVVNPRPVTPPSADMGWIDGATIVTDERGKSWPLAEAPPRVKFRSPLRPDRTPSCDLWPAPDGTRWLTDWSTGQRWRVVSPGPTLSFSDPAPGDVPAATEPGPGASGKEGAARVSTEVSIIDIPADAWGPDHLPDLGELLPSGGLALLDLPLRGGKTTLASRWSEGRSCLVITPGVALTGHAAARFNSALYSDGPAALQERRLATTTHSARKATVHLVRGPIDLDDLEQYRRDLVVVDEADQVRAAWHSAPLRVGGVDAKEATLAHLCEARWGVLATADWTPEERAWWIAAYRRRCPNARIVVVRQERAAGTRRVVHVREAVLRQTFEDWLRRVAADRSVPPVCWGMTSEGGPEVEAERVREKYPDLRVFWVSSRNSDTPEVRRYLRDPDALVRDHDVILYSPSISSGLSTDVPVSQVLWSTDGVTVPSEIGGQMLARWRRPVCSDYLVSCKAVRNDLSVDPDILVKIARGLQEATRAKVDVTQVHWHYDFQRHHWKPHDDEVFASWMLEERRARARRNDSLGSLVEMCARHRWAYVDRRDVAATPDAESSGRREVRERVEQRHAQEVAKARRISAERAEEIRRQYTRQPAEKLELERHRISNFYASDTVEPDLVLRDQRGRTPNKVRDYVLAYLYGRGVRRWSVVRDHLAARGRDGDDDRDPTTWRHHYLRARAFDAVVRALTGLAVGPELEGCEIDRDALVGRVRAMLADSKLAFSLSEVLKARPSKKERADPVRWALRLLARIGITSTSRQYRSSRARRRMYVLRVSDFHDLARAERVRAVRAMYEARTGIRVDAGPTEMPGPATPSVEEMLALLLDDAA